MTQSREPLPLPDPEDLDSARGRVGVWRQAAFMAAAAAIAFFVLAPELGDGAYETHLRVLAYVSLGLEGIAVAAFLVFSYRLRRLERQISRAEADDWTFIRGVERLPAQVSLEDVDPSDPARVAWSCSNCKAHDDAGPMALVDAVGHAIASHGATYIGLDPAERRAAIINDWQESYRADPDTWGWVMDAQKARGMTIFPTPDAGH